MESQADSIFSNTQTIENYDAELWRALNLESDRQEEHIGTNLSRYANSLSNKSVNLSVSSVISFQISIN